MENKKCEFCGTIMKERIEGSSIVYICSKCGNKIASTYNKGIEWDPTLYSIMILKNQSLVIKNIKFVSDISGLNYMKSKELLINGGLLIKDRAEKVLNVLLEMKKEKIDINIVVNPGFKYC